VHARDEHILGCVLHVTKNLADLLEPSSRILLVRPASASGMATAISSDSPLSGFRDAIVVALPSCKLIA
jgi:hypothetical protein